MNLSAIVVGILYIKSPFFSTLFKSIQNYTKKCVSVGNYFINKDQEQTHSADYEKSSDTLFYSTYNVLQNSLLVRVESLRRSECIVPDAGVVLMMQHCWAGATRHIFLVARSALWRHRLDISFFLGFYWMKVCLLW